MTHRITYLFLLLFSFSSAKSQSIIPFESNNKWGYMFRADSSIVVPATYDTVLAWDYPYGIVGMNNKYGYVNESGVEFIPPSYEKCEGFHGEYASVRINGKWGLINTEGKIMIDAIYDSELKRDYYSKYVSACLNHKWGLLDLKGKILIPFEYDEALYGHDGLFAATKNGQAGYLNKKGKTMIPFIYTYTYDFYSDLAEVQLDTLVGMINKKGEVIIPIEFSYVYESDYDVIEVTKNNLYGLYSYNGTQLCKPIYEKLYEYDYGYRFAEIGNNHSLINVYGVAVIEDASAINESDISGDILIFYFDDMAGLYSISEDRIISKARFHSYEELESEYTILVSLNNKFGLISYETGEIIINPEYDNIESLDFGLYQVVSGEKSGIIDSYGKMILPVQYSSVWTEGPKLLGAIDEEGNEIYFDNKGARVTLDE